MSVYKTRVDSHDETYCASIISKISSRKGGYGVAVSSCWSQRPATGDIFGTDYRAVSQERKRLHERLLRNGKLDELMQRLEFFLSMVEI